MIQISGLSQQRLRSVEQLIFMLGNFGLVASLAFAADPEEAGRVLVGLAFVTASLAALRGAFIEPEATNGSQIPTHVLFLFVGAACSVSVFLGLFSNLAIESAIALPAASIALAANEYYRWRAIYGSAAWSALVGACLWLAVQFGLLLIFLVLSFFEVIAFAASPALLLYIWMAGAVTSIGWLFRTRSSATPKSRGGDTSHAIRVWGGIEVGSQALGEAALAAAVGITYSFSDVTSFRLALSVFAPANAIASSFRSGVLIENPRVTASIILAGLKPFAAVAAFAVAALAAVEVGLVSRNLLFLEELLPSLALVAPLFPSRAVTVLALLNAAGLRANGSHRESVLLKVVASSVMVILLLALSPFLTLSLAVAIGGALAFAIVLVMVWSSGRTGRRARTGRGSE